MPVRAAYFSAIREAIVFPSFVDFRDDYELAAELQDSEDFAHVPWQIGPPEVCFHGGGERKRQLRNRAVADLNAAKIYPPSIRSLCYGDALLGIVHAVDFSLLGDCR
jgi:hypothetical protein